MRLELQVNNVARAILQNKLSSASDSDSEQKAIIDKLRLLLQKQKDQAKADNEAKDAKYQLEVKSSVEIIQELSKKQDQDSKKMANLLSNN